MSDIYLQICAFIHYQKTLEYSGLEIEYFYLHQIMEQWTISQHIL